MDKSVKKAIYSILHYLYFYDIVAISSTTEKKLDVYEDLLNDLQNIVENMNFVEQRGEVYKHLLLCYLEISADAYISRNMYLTKVKASSEIRIKLNKIVEEHNFDINQFKNHSEFLNYKYKVHLEPEVAYKLVHRLYHYLFGLFSLNFLIKIIEVGIIKTSKYQESKSRYSENFLNNFFLHSMLFIEFELLKKSVYLKNNEDFKYMESKKNLGNDELVAYIRKLEDFLKEYSGKPVDITKVNFNEKIEIVGYIEKIGERLQYKNFFTDNLAIWFGLVGASLLLFWRHQIPKILIYANDESLNDAAAKASDTMFNFGFTLNKRTIYKHYNAVSLYFDFVFKFHSDNFLKNGSEILGLDPIDYFEYMLMKSRMDNEQLEYIKKVWQEKISK